MAESKALVPVVDEPKSYLAIQQDPQELALTIQANLGGEELSAFDLNRIKIPTAGGKSWIVPTLEGEELQKEITGVIVSNRLTRSYWKETNPDGSPPDCSSPDSVLGYGNPGDGLRAEDKGCADCPLSQFGSSTKEESPDGQACGQYRQLFLLDPEEMLPFVVQLPPTSLKNAKGFLTKLTSKAIPYWGVIVKIGLEAGQSGGGQDYSKATFEVVKRLDAETMAQVKAYADALAPVLEKTKVVRDGDTAGGKVFDPDAD